MLAELFLDLGGGKTKRLDWITIAEKCQEVVHKYGSVKEAARILGKSASLISAILRMKKLDPRIQNMVKNGDLGFDSAQRLNTIKNMERQYEVAKLLVGASNKQQREIIQYAKRFPESDIVTYRSRVLGQSVKKKRLRVLIIPIPEQVYRDLQEASGKRQQPLEKMVPEIIQNWLKTGGASL